MTEIIHGNGPLAMIVGPSQPSPRVLGRLSEPARPLTDGDFIRLQAQCLRRLRQVAHADNAVSIVVPGTGTIALESIVVSLLDPGRPVLVLSTGWWGDTWRDICGTCGYQADCITVPAGDSPDIGKLEDALSSRPYQAVLATHVESSTGLRADVRAVAEVARSHGALCLIDGVAALGAELVDFSRWGIDAYVASPQKAIAAPAGLALTLLSQNAIRVLSDRNWRARSYGLDLARWVPAMRAAEEGMFGYFQTPAGNLLAGLAAALELIVAEGLPERVARHQDLRERLHAGLADLDLRSLVSDEPHQSNGITACWTPAGWNAAEFVSAMEDAGVLVQTGTHPMAVGNSFRIGHLGNVSRGDIDMTLAALRKVCR
jgi:alanine-glyoxylate transaminase/serine-glyoxylate transaminase/serine-pyruvate transaminase